MSEREKKIGIFGGSFSPPHEGHVHALRSFLSEEDPDIVYVIPSYQSPQKAMISDVTPEQRLDMCRLAFSFDPRVSVSDMEIRRGGKSYTVDTLTALVAPRTKLLLLCGTDMLLTLDKWYRAKEIFAMADIVWQQRDDENDAETYEKTRQKISEYREHFGATIRKLHFSPRPLSSTVCRERIFDHMFSTENLPSAVREYIEKWHLYQ